MFAVILISFYKNEYIHFFCYVEKNLTSNEIIISCTVLYSLIYLKGLIVDN